MLSTAFLVVLATTIMPLDPGKLPARSTLIVTGCVTSTRTTRNDDTMLEKLSAIQVGAVLKGTSRPSIRVRTRTGFLFFDDHLERGQSGVFFLKAAENGVYEAAYPGGFALFPDGTAQCR